MTVSIHKKVAGTAGSLVLIAIGAVVYWFVTIGIDRAAGWSRIVFQPWASILAATCFLIGVFWILWSYSYLLYVGKGLPLEVFGRPLHPTSTLVTTGPYAYVRNPMVLGLLFVLLGIAFLRGSLSAFLLLPAVAVVAWLYLAIFEEKELVTRFGDDYIDYRRRVPLLIPRPGTTG